MPDGPTHPTTTRTGSARHDSGARHRRKRRRRARRGRRRHQRRDGPDHPTTSNDEGNYRVPFLNPGTYRVTVTLDGFSKFVSQDVELHVADVLTVDALLPAGQRSPTRSRSARTAAVVDGTSRRTRTGRRHAADLRAADSRGQRRRAGHPRARRRQHDGPAFAQGRVQQRPVAVLERRRRREAQRLHDRRRRQRRRRSRRLQPAVGRGRGVQDPDRDLRRGNRQHHGRVRQRRDQERHQQAARAGLRVVPRLDARRQQLLRQARRPAQARLHGQPLRRRGRRPDRCAIARSISPTSSSIRSRCRHRRSLTVPTEKMRNGDFSELLALGPQYQIYDPATIRPHPTQAGRFTRDPFPGNIIPQNRIDPVARKILDYYPLPNQPGTADGAQQLRESDGGRRRDATTRRRRASITACRIVIASTAATAGTSGKRRRTTASTTSPPASSSTARTACSRSTMRTRSRTTC